MKNKIVKLACLSLVTAGALFAVVRVRADDYPTSPVSPFVLTPPRFNQGLVKDTFSLTDSQIKTLKTKGKITTKFVSLVPWQRVTDVEISTLAPSTSHEGAFIYFDESSLSAVEDGKMLSVLFTDGVSSKSRIIYLKKEATNFVTPSDDVIPSLNELSR